MTTAPEDRSRPTEGAEIPAPPPGLDLASLRIEAAAGVLRDWAAQTVSELLARDDAVAVAHGRLAELKLAAWHWRRREARRLERGIRAPLHLSHETASPDHPISLLLARYLRSRRSWWRRWLPRRLTSVLALADPYWPPPLWPVISHLAWREPRFQRDVAAAVLKHLRGRLLMVEEEPATPVFRVQVWWLALDLIGIPALGQPPERGAYVILRKLLGDPVAKALWRSWHRRSGRGALGRRLSSIAREEILASSGWAGFWEQWLTGELMLRWPELVAAASSESRQLLDVLPLLSETPYRATRNRVALPAPKSVTRELSVIVDPRWEACRPGVRHTGVRPTGVRPSGAAALPPAPRR